MATMAAILAMAVGFMVMRRKFAFGQVIVLVGAVAVGSMYPQLGSACTTTVTTVWMTATSAVTSLATALG